MVLARFKKSAILCIVAEESMIVLLILLLWLFIGFISAIYAYMTAKDVSGEDSSPDQ